jgi:hypothetical protein
MKRYMNEFFKLKCAPDLLAWKLFPNAKEITESFGAFKGVRDVILEPTNLRFDDPSIVLVSVGDGVTPRTAALFAVRTSWECYSVDPLMRVDVNYPIDRLSVIKAKIEDLKLDFPERSVIIVSVHGHAKLNDILEHIHGKVRHFLTIPCCISHNIPNKVYLGYTDTNIWSDKNEVKVWLNI